MVLNICIVEQLRDNICLRLIETDYWGGLGPPSCSIGGATGPPGPHPSSYFTVNAILGKLIHTSWINMCLSKLGAVQYTFLCSKWLPHAHSYTVHYTAVHGGIFKSQMTKCTYLGSNNLQCVVHCSSILSRNP